jgi:hypothetical protein
MINPKERRDIKRGGLFMSLIPKFFSLILMF